MPRDVHRHVLYHKVRKRGQKTESETAPQPKSKWRTAERTQHGYEDSEKYNNDLENIKRTERAWRTAGEKIKANSRRE